MGRGLSELQKRILIMGYQNRGRRYKAGNVKNNEVLMEVYRFPSHPPSADTTSGTPQIFRRNEIGIRKYRSASVSVVKAFNRLVKRGLAVREHNHGIILTAKGTKTAKSLFGGSVKSQSGKLPIIENRGLAVRVCNLVRGSRCAVRR